MRSITFVREFLQPLERKLPLLIAALLCAVVAAFGWMVNRELRTAFESAAGDRLAGASQRIASMLVAQTAALKGDARALVADPAIVAALEHRDDVTRAAATARLGEQRPAPTAPASRALFTASCELVAAAGPLANTGALDQCAAARANGASSREWMQPMLVWHDTVYYAVVAPVVIGSADTAGYVVHLRRLGDSRSAQALSSFIGRGASLLIGNAVGPELWTDLSRATAGPPRGVQRGSLVKYTPASGVPSLGVALDISATPWVVMVQMPEVDAHAGQYQTLRRLAIVAALCVLLGMLGAWMLGNHVTRPLVELTRAADDLAGGNYARRAQGARRDELGLLVSSFNRMADKVQATTAELSEQAEELEHRFHEAQDLAHELEVSNQELSEAAQEAERAHHERELAESLLEEVLAQAPFGIAVLDSSLRYVRVNAALATMNGVPAEQHVGRRPTDVVPGFGASAEAHLRRVLASGEALSDERPSDSSVDGARRYWLANYFPVRDTMGAVTGAGIIVLDTTSHHDLEAQLLQAQKMEAVGRLAGGVAHDFNNLLTVISSYSEMALQTLPHEDPLYADMKEIRSSADRASRLTRQLLAFSRKQVMQPQVLDLNRVATEMERMLRRLIGEDVKFALDLSRGIGEVRADPGQIEQVMMNLVLNARDAMPDGGQLAVRTSNETVHEEIAVGGQCVPPGEYVALRVSDTGTGMDENTMSHLFEPFFTTKETGQGTGLGLSTVYGIVKQSGGEILVRSLPGAGSTFTVYLPRLVRRDGLAPDDDGQRQDVGGGTETVLLVEDDGALRNLARRILKSAGYTVIEARTANAAIELGATYPGRIDLLLTDVVMPQVNGRAVGERLRALRPGIRVLFMSGYTDDMVMKRGIRSAQTDFLQKPFTPEQLVRRIREVLDAPERAPHQAALGTSPTRSA